MKYVIAGIGNPGSEHAGQRHNVGFWFINRLAKKHGISMSTGKQASTGKGRIGEAEVVLVKPRTFVNSSGRAIGPILKHEGVPVHQLIVVYDDLDLPEGRIRLRQRGGSGGHNGLKSIVESAGGDGFGRVRIGIGRPHDHFGVPTWDPEIIVRYVLAEPPKASREAIDAAIERAAEAVEAVIRDDDWKRAMDFYNRQEPEKEPGTRN